MFWLLGEGEGKFPGPRYEAVDVDGCAWLAAAVVVEEVRVIDLRRGLSARLEGGSVALWRREGVERLQVRPLPRMPPLVGPCRIVWL